MGEDDAVPHDQGVAEARARVAARREIEKSGRRVASAELGPYLHKVEALAGEGRDDS